MIAYHAQESLGSFPALLVLDAAKNGNMGHIPKKLWVKTSETQDGGYRQAHETGLHFHAPLEMHIR